MPEVVAEIVESFTSVALERAEETFANGLKRLGDSGPEIANPVPPLVPATEFIPAIEDALDSIEESSDSTVDLVRDCCPQFAGLLKVAEDRSENGSPT